MTYLMGLIGKRGVAENLLGSVVVGNIAFLTSWLLKTIAPCYGLQIHMTQ